MLCGLGASYELQPVFSGGASNPASLGLSGSTLGSRDPARLLPDRGPHASNPSLREAATGGSPRGLGLLGKNLCPMQPAWLQPSLGVDRQCS